MYIDFEDRPELDRIASPISRREGILLSIIGHLAIVILILVGPSLPWVREALDKSAAERAEQLRQLELAQQRQARRFVFVAPRLDTEAPKPPLTLNDSDKNRIARSPERNPAATNPLPFARGNTSEMVEAEPPPVERSRPAPEPPPGEQLARDTNAQPNANGSAVMSDTGRDGAQIAQSPVGPQNGARGRGQDPTASLGEALRNLQRYAHQQETFGNEQGGGGPWGPSIQFDTKGVEFGPWIRRFIAQIKRNWFIPYAAMSLKGHTVLTFNVHKTGALTDLTVLRPSSIDAFNNAAFNALTGSNPTMPLPEEYPSESAFFTVTFYYNETPPSP